MLWYVNTYNLIKCIKLSTMCISFFIIFAVKFIDACNELCKICEIPTLEKYGIDKDEFFTNMDKMADDAMASGSPSNTIKELNKDDLLNIYKELWK